MRGFLFEQYLARAIGHLLPHQLDGVLNLVPGTGQSLYEILKMIRDHLQLPFGIVYRKCAHQRDFDLSYNISVE